MTTQQANSGETSQPVVLPIMTNAGRNMMGRSLIASVPSKAGSQEVTYVDSYRIDGELIQPVLTLSGLGSAASTHMKNMMSVTPKDAVVVTTTIKPSPDADRGYRVTIGMGTDARSVVGRRGFRTVVDGDQQTLELDKEIQAMDFLDLPMELRNWVHSMVVNDQEQSIEAIQKHLNELQDGDIGVMAYGQGPLGVLQDGLTSRGFLGTTAGSSANISHFNDDQLIDLLLALLSVLTPDEQYQKIAEARRNASQTSL